METLDRDSPDPTSRHFNPSGDLGAHLTPTSLRSMRDLRTGIKPDFDDAARSATATAVGCLMIIGAGKTAESMATSLGHARSHRLIVANRTMLNAQFLADRLGGVAVPLADIADHLAQADMVVSCTASEQPILSRAVVEEAIRIRHHKPLFLVDIAQRGDVDAEVRTVQDVFFARLSDLDLLANETATDGAEVSSQAEAILRWQWQHYRAWQEAITSHASMSMLQSSAEENRDSALKKACQLLKAGRTPAEALEFLAQTLTNKFMHAPSASLRAASLRGDTALMQAAERLFDPQGIAQCA